nr:methionine aminopeptidase 1D, mitochondrial isoform X2 [Leptinotarsa decemlineata]
MNFGKYKIVDIGNISPMVSVPEYIKKPSYHETGIPSETVPEHPEIKNHEQISRMRDSCRLAAYVLDKVEKFIEVGKTTDDIDVLVFKTCIENNAYPSPLNYKHFPKSVCTSVNNVACHGIPDDRPLQDGDIINVDVTVYYNGFHGDCSKTFLVGQVDNDGRDLVKATETCLNEAIQMCKPGKFFRDIGALIEERAYSLGYQVVPAFIGHGIGHYFHGPPDIYHTRNNYPGIMAPGMTFTIEPILTQGSEMIEILPDDWTAVTVDDSRTAQFEHTVLITELGAEILTTTT